MQRTFFHFGGRHLTAVGLAILMLASLGCASDDPSGPDADFTAPSVNTTDPLPEATGVGLITASFSESMLITSIQDSTFTVTGPGREVLPGIVTYNSYTRIAQFLPDHALTSDTGYTAMVTTGVQDLSGNAMAADYSWRFTTSEFGPGRPHHIPTRPEVH